MKKNILKLGIVAITILAVATSCSKKDTAKPTLPAGTLIKKVTKDDQDRVISYTKFIYKNAKLDSANTYDKNNILSDYIAFSHLNNGNLLSTNSKKANEDAVEINYFYQNNILTSVDKNDKNGFLKAVYNLTYDANNKIIKIDLKDPIGTIIRTNVITYNTDGKVKEQNNSFFTGGTPTGSGFFISEEDEGDDIKYMEYYPQTIKSLAPPMDNLIVKQYVKKAQIGTDVFFYETSFNELNNPTKTIKKKNDQNGAIVEVVTYEYQ